MKYLKFKENHGEGTVIGYLILAGLLLFVAIVFLAGKNLTGVMFSLGCVVLSILGMLDNILIVNLMTKVSKVNADCNWWREKYVQICNTCEELRTKQVELTRELDITKCQLEASKKATQNANQQIRHLEAELNRFKSSTPKDDKDSIELLKQPNKKKSNRDGYSLFLHHCGPSILRVVKIIVHHITHDLRKAKDLADNVPCIIVENISKDEANLIHNELTNEGASVSIKC